MSPTLIIPSIVAFAFLGVGLAFQGVATATMGTSLKMPSAAALLGFLIGLVPVTIYFFIEWSIMGYAPLTFNEVPWWSYLAGILGAGYIVGITILTPYVGTSIIFGTVILFQILTAVIFDHFGAFGIPRVQMSRLTMAGIVLQLFGCLFIVVSAVREQLMSGDQNSIQEASV